MSKKRPSQLLGFVESETTEGQSLERDLSYWAKRLFKNTFTYRGRVVQTRRWCVKIQFQGRRKTLSLSSSDRLAAAAEAIEIYSTLLKRGWEAVLARAGSVSVAASARELSAETDCDDKTSPAFWKPRLVVRKYTEPLGPKLRRELSVRIGHEGVSHYFPLGTEDADVGAARAVEIYETVRREGWDHVKSCYTREFTVGILWANNPFACTYATLYTILPGAEEHTRAVDVGKPGQVIIADADEGIGRALSFWVGRGTGLPRVSALPSVAAAARVLETETPTLLLVNQDLGGAREWIENVRARKPNLMAFVYGVFENSDDIFASVTGVSRGYMLRRRPPALLLEPIARTLAAPAASRAEASRQIRQHFQHLFDPSGTIEEPQNPISLTRREQEILDFLSKGYLDKEIALNLGISAWTVHSHLKRIYEKLGVHTRTEAVVRYLQK